MYLGQVSAQNKGTAEPGTSSPLANINHMYIFSIKIQVMELSDLFNRMGVAKVNKRIRGDGSGRKRVAGALGELF